MHTSVLNPGPVLGLGSGLLPMSRRPIPVFPVLPVLGALESAEPVEIEEPEPVRPVDWRQALEVSAAAAPGVGRALRVNKLTARVNEDFACDCYFPSWTTRLN